MIATQTVIVDGQTYHKGDTIPDLGSLECTSADGNVREYQGLSVDASKLPHYANLGAGSSCLMLDTSDVYIYHKTTDEWKKL